MGKTQLERYEELGIEESLKLTHRYPVVCKELSFILRSAYSKLPKFIQALLFQHSLSAFRLLPMMQTQRAVAAANVLIKSAEAVLPKQKKVVAVKEFKNAKVYHKRHKERQEEGPSQLPHDALERIFGFLDLKSLLSASSVCRTWNRAASENHLWKLLYLTCFGDTRIETNIDWRMTFKEKYEGSSMERFLFDRGFCEHCNAIVWLSNMNCPNKHGGTCFRSQLKPVSAAQIVEYVLKGNLYMSSFESESDSDYSEDEFLSKLWASHRLQ